MVSHFLQKKSPTIVTGRSQPWSVCLLRIFVFWRLSHAHPEVGTNPKNDEQDQEKESAQDNKALHLIVIQAEGVHFFSFALMIKERTRSVPAYPRHRFCKELPLP